MLRAQSEARRTRCPMEAGGMNVSPERASTRPDQWPDGPGRYCIGERCMWWRWGSAERLTTWTGAEWKGAAPVPTSEFQRPFGTGWDPLPNTIAETATRHIYAMQWVRCVDNTRAGYCGGAGRPIEEAPQ